MKTIFDDYLNRNLKSIKLKNHESTKNIVKNVSFQKFQAGYKIFFDKH